MTILMAAIEFQDRLRRFGALWILMKFKLWGMGRLESQVQ